MRVAAPAALVAPFLFGFVATVTARTTPVTPPPVVVTAAQGSTSAFPHPLHAGLFPQQCALCHGGIPAGDSATMFPSPSTCANCHDGTVQPVVPWKGHTPRISNLAFSHTRHQQSISAAGDSITCLTCHRTPGDTGVMAVGAPQPQYCIGCHAHAAPAHTDTAAHCATCHVPVTRTALPVSRIAEFPKPDDHSAPDWILQHAPASPDIAAGRCAVCHARQSCQRCHFNAASIPAIQQLQPDARIASLVRGRAPSYPKPTTHDSTSWSWKHGLVAGGGGVGVGGVTPATVTCSNCHAQESCRTCHRDGDTPAINALPSTRSDTVLGVPIPPKPVHAPGFLKAHPAQAAAGGTCDACHARSFCVNCHQGQKSEYHPLDFVQQHGPEAYSSDAQCTACHSTETFCRTCHLRTGLGARERTKAAFHSAQPLWLLNHGQAARQGLESCAACHTQSSCAQCHSATGGWGVNPHPANFDARRAARLNSQSCLLCHIKVPGG